MGRLVVMVVVLDGCGGGDGPGAIGAVARTATAAAAVATVTVTGRRGQGQAEVIFGGGQLGQREHRSSGAGIVDWWEVQTNRDDDGSDEVPRRLFVASSAKRYSLRNVPGGAKRFSFL
uniref:(northern house mosquito) hypothetical protein n=1 Tax=Culex pipiens TaxID=7175 RepID=A0A8D8BIY5_CULPI